MAWLVACSACAVAGCHLDSETPKMETRGLILAAENTIHLCSDGLDNDGDTLVDCEDDECRASSCSEADRLPIKKDFSGKKISGGIDACQKCSDRLCVNPDGEQFLPGDTVCPWYREYNSDGSVIVGDDGKTWKLAETTNYTCSDGSDNDDDGYADCRDRSCTAITACCIKSMSDENEEAACHDGLDNDCDGYTDCSDRSCLAFCCTALISTDEAKGLCNPASTEYYDAEKCESMCSDGVDSDCNSYIDCNDNNCKSSQYCMSKSSEANQPVPEDDEDTCSNGKDDDMDGYIDCGDSGCAATAYCADVVASGVVEPGIRPHDFDTWFEVAKLDRYCQEKRLCTNGIDDDKNGMTDCQEYQCHMLSLKWDDYRKAMPDGDLRCYAFTCGGAAVVPCAVDPCAQTQE